MFEKKKRCNNWNDHSHYPRHFLTSSFDIQSYHYSNFRLILIFNYLHFSKIWYNMTDWSNKLELFGRLMESGDNFRRKPFIFKILLLKTIAIELLFQWIHYKLFSIQVYDRRPIPRFKWRLKSFWQPDVMRKTRMLLAN